MGSKHITLKSQIRFNLRVSEDIPLEFSTSITAEQLNEEGGGSTPCTE